jgi:hypothetical protein
MDDARNYPPSSPPGSAIFQSSSIIITSIYCSNHLNAILFRPKLQKGLVHVILCKVRRWEQVSGRCLCRLSLGHLGRGNGTPKAIKALGNPPVTERVDQLAVGHQRQQLYTNRLRRQAAALTSGLHHVSRRTAPAQ